MRAEPGPVEQRFERALENAERFFMKTGKVHQAAMALGAHGYERVTSIVPPAPMGAPPQGR